MINPNHVDIYYHEWHQYDDLFDVLFKIPDGVSKEQIQFHLLNDNACFKAQINEEYPFFAGSFSAPVKSFEKEFSVDDHGLKLTFKKPEDTRWDLIFTGPVNETDIMDPQSLFEHGKLNSSQEEIDRAASMNFPPALLELTKLNKTEDEINEIYEKAADYHDPFALFMVGMTCLRNNEIDKAIEKLREAESRGDLNSKDALGEIYSPLVEPHIIDEDVNIALQKFNEVIESRPNHPYALYNLALLYLNGCGVEKDVNKAHEMYEKAKSIEPNIPKMEFPTEIVMKKNIKYFAIGAVVILAGASLIYLTKRRNHK